MAVSRSRIANVRRSKRKVDLPARYSKEYPTTEGHDYSLNSIPLDIWERAKRRAHSDQRSIREVLIKALDLYASKRLNV